MNFQIILWNLYQKLKDQGKKLNHDEALKRYKLSMFIYYVNFPW